VGSLASALSLTCSDTLARHPDKRRLELSLSFLCDSLVQETFHSNAAKLTLPGLPRSERIAGNPYKHEPTKLLRRRMNLSSVLASNILACS
jgi:hypothetical protein